MENCNIPLNHISEIDNYVPPWKLLTPTIDLKTLFNSVAGDTI